MQNKEMISFLEQLLERVKLSPNLPPNEVHVFNVHASYGHYQVIIGPAEKILNCGDRATHSVEINGALHHLFITKNHVAPHPTQHQIHNNLKGCVILRDLALHIKDPTGTGRKVMAANKHDSILAREKINLAGMDGEKFIMRMENSGRLAKDTYKIVQEDILNALANKQYTID